MIVLVGFTPVTALGIETALANSVGSPWSSRSTRVGSPTKAVELVERDNTELVVIDLYCPTFEEGLDVCRRVKSLKASPRILAFSDLRADRALAFSHLAGIDSFVSATEPPERLASVAAATMEGRCEWIFASNGDRRPSIGMTSSLTLREQEVLWMLSNRCTNEQIGRSLSISPNTVKNHVAAILRKLGAKRRSELFLGPLNLKHQFETTLRP